VDIWGRSIPGKEKNQHKGLGWSWFNMLRSSKEAIEDGTQ